MRTQQQVIEDCEKAYLALKAEKERRDKDPIIQRPCKSCRWFSNIGDDGYRWCVSGYIDEYGTCTHPLVKGFNKYGKTARNFPMPCGPEKALWEPKPTLWQRVLAFFGVTD